MIIGLSIPRESWEEMGEKKDIAILAANSMYKLPIVPAKGWLTLILTTFLTVFLYLEKNYLNLGKVPHWHLSNAP